MTRRSEAQRKYDTMSADVERVKNLKADLGNESSVEGELLLDLALEYSEKKMDKKNFRNWSIDPGKW